jgi:hypothetical protein
LTAKSFVLPQLAEPSRDPIHYARLTRREGGGYFEFADLLNFPIQNYVDNYTDQEDSSMTERPKDTPLPKWLPLIVVPGALLLAAGAIIALANPGMLATPGIEINGAVRVYAGYLVARNLALALLLLVTLSMGARRALSTLMVLTAAIQILDAVMDGVEGRWPLIPGVLVIGALFLFGAARITGSPIWRAAAWREIG